MKKIIAIIVLLGCFGSAEAQKASKQKYVPDASFLYLKEGKLIMNDHGTEKVMEEDVTIGNGKVITLDGFIIAKDGKKLLLKEGEKISMDGKVSLMQTTADRPLTR